MIYFRIKLLFCLMKVALFLGWETLSQYKLLFYCLKLSCNPTELEF